MIGGWHTPELIWYPVLKYGFIVYVVFYCLPYVKLKVCLSLLIFFLQLSQRNDARIFVWGSVLAKNPNKEKYLMEIFPEQYNQSPQVSNIERVRHRETDSIAKVKVNAFPSVKVYQFITELEESSSLTLSTHRGDATLMDKNHFWVESDFAITEVKKRLQG